MSLTVDQVLALAPDPASATAGRKLGSPKTWKGLGHDERALWGECQGSALYQVKVDLADLTASCSCPSRKFPCKHGLGLLVLHASGHVPGGAAPGWVAEWIGKRAEKAEKKAAKAAEPVDPAAAEKAAAQAAKRAEKRLDRMAEGLDGLDAWMADIVREGLASVETKGPQYFEAQAARLVDAQASGLAGRVRRIGELVGAGEDWPRRVLEELGQAALLAHAFRRVDQLDPALQATVRQLVGLNEKQEQILASGERVADVWAVAGQSLVDDEPSLREQRTWLVGAKTGRVALFLQFAPGKQPFAVNILAGSAYEGSVAFYPGVASQRGLLADRGLPLAWPGRIPGHATISAALDATADLVAAQPWAATFGWVLRDVVPALSGSAWALVDSQGDALPMSGVGAWKLLAVSGGRPVDVFGEWDGRAFLPLGAWSSSGFVPVGGR
jgi:hypothetical protein